MRATAQAETTGVANDLHALTRHLMRATQGDVFQLAFDLELSLSQLRVLHVLAREQDEPSLMELAAAIGLSVAATGRAVDALVRKRFVARREDADDRRVKRVHATETGIAYVEQFAAAKLDAVREMLKSLDADQQRRLFEALAPLAEIGCAR